MIKVVVASLMIYTMMMQVAQASFECPSSIEEFTPAKIGEIRQVLPQENLVDDPVRLNASVDTLKSLGLTKSQIINHLIGAYCPYIARESLLTDAEKTAKVRGYASKVAMLVYEIEDASSVVLNIALKPSVVDELREKARKSGLSVQDWIANAIEKSLD